MIRIRLDEEDFRRLVKGEVVEQKLADGHAGAVRVILADIGFDVMAEAINDAMRADEPPMTTAPRTTCNNCGKPTSRRYGIWDVLSCSQACDRALDDALEDASAQLTFDPASVMPPLYTVERLADYLRPDDRSIDVDRVADLLRFLVAVGLVERVGVAKSISRPGTRSVYRVERDIAARLAMWIDERMPPGQ